MSGDPPPEGLVCLGASAGGLRSLEAIVARLPADSPWPILISQHLQPDRISQMPDILARVANLRVKEAADREMPQPGTIYTGPSGSELGVTTDGRLSLRPIVAGRPQRIDHLFATASYARPGRTIAVVLSGTGTDGAVGALVVKLNQGVVITESSESAEYGSMPAATQRAVHVDATLKADAIATLLDDLARGGLETSTSATRTTVAQIAAVISDPHGTDFTRYRASTLRRQAEKRRALLGLPSLEAYRDRLVADMTERQALTRSLLIPVTEFFRDPLAWRALEEHVVPMLASKARDGGIVRVWCAGCASGEEAYSIAILLSESIADKGRIQILATDLDANAVENARLGLFDASRMEGVDALRRERFFRPEGHAFRARDELREMVHARVHDITRDPPPGQFDLIICRNLLIYFDASLQASILDDFHDALDGPRILFLGQSETIPPRRKGFIPVARARRIFQANGPRPTPARSAAASRADAASRSAWSGVADARVEAPDTIILVVDASWNILGANPHARSVLEGDPTGKRLLEIFPRWQASPIEDALGACASTGRSLKVRGAPMPTVPMDVSIEPAPGAPQHLLLIATPAQRGGDAAGPDEREASEDLSAAHDELQATNEELAAANEELQATNEELASLNEEFQSTNQTLASSNVELGEVAKTTRADSELVHEFLQARDQAFVALDAEKRVTFFNRKASEVFGIKASNIGRPIHLVDLGPGAGDLDAALREALERPAGVILDAGQGRILVIEHVSDRSGTPLGWVLTARPP